MNWFVSDLHFSHSRVIEYCSRPYDSVEEMNAALIENYNSCVAEDDTVYNLGDMFMGKGDNIKEVCNKLNGRMLLIQGNHDYKKRVEKIVEATQCYVAEVWTERCDVDNLVLTMIHDPEEVDWECLEKISNTSGQDYIVLYGHVHDNAPKEMEKVAPHVYKFHVGVDTNDYKPVSWDYIKSLYLDLKENNEEA